MVSRKGMRPLVVRRITPQSAGIVSIDLAAPDGAELAPWQAGAHLDMQLITRQQRQYSLCGDPADRRSYRIAVLREELSRGASMYIHDHLREGRTIWAADPRNLFPVQPAERYLLLAAGIGITPLLAMARELAGRGAAWSMNFAVRDGGDVPFAGELAELGDVVTVNAPNRPTGRLDLGALLALPHPGTAVYTCGPTRFTDAIVDAMRAWPAGSLHLERFEPKPPVQRPNAAFTVLCARSDIRVEVPDSRSTLWALQAKGLPVQGSCLRGVCGSCAVTVLAGEPDHRDSLTTDETSTTIYPCVSRSLTPELVIDL